jgi:CBS domain-containing protein
MKCEDLMKRDTECVSPSETAQDAARKMRDQNVGFLPVCESNNRVVGTITDRDIAIRLVAEDQDAETPVSAIMTRDVVACRDSDEIERAVELMALNRKSRIICLDENDRLCGVISLSDLAQRAGAGHAVETMRRVTERRSHATP